MNIERKNKMKELLWKLLFFAVVIILFFSFKLSLDNKEESLLLYNGSYNTFFKEMPEEYLELISQAPIDSVLDENEIRAQKNRVLKYDIYLLDKEYARELVAIKEISKNDTTQLRTISFNVYPENKGLIKDGKDFFRLAKRPVNYSHEGVSYRIAKQVLPNIVISKIEPYSRYWKTTVDSIDNSTFSPIQPNTGFKMFQQDSLLLGLNVETSVYGFLLSKQLEANGIGFLSQSKEIRRQDFLNPQSKLNQTLQDQKLQLIKVSDEVSFWEKIANKKELGKTTLFNLDSAEVNKKMASYFAGDLKFSDLFDVEKLAFYYSLINLYSDGEDNELFLSYNRDSKLIEPFFINKKLGTLNRYVKDLKLTERSFLEEYFKTSTKLSTLDSLEELIETYKDEIRNILVINHSFSLGEIFERDLFYHNKLIIEKSLKPSTTAKISLIQKSDTKIEVEIKNLSNFPIEIIELSHKENRHITAPQEKELIQPNTKEIVVFDLPDSFNNLFVHKKKKSVGFIFEKDIFDLRVGYKLLGDEDAQYGKIVPFKDFDDLAFENQDLFRNEWDSDIPYLFFNKDSKVISFAQDSVVIDKPLLIPEGYVLEANEGLHIDIVDGGKIISKSALNLIGSKKAPIKIYSSDKKGQGLLILNAKKVSELKYVLFQDLTNVSHGLWQVSGALTFYESRVNMDYVTMSGNRCEDGINIVRSKFNMTNTTFLNTQSDAFDGDFVTGKLSNCTFRNLGNDAVDVSGSTLNLANLKIVHAGDKAISAGEDSKVEVKQTSIYDSEIAIAGKDLSIIHAEDLVIKNCKLAFTAFKKKPEFGPSNIIANQVLLEGVQTEHLIENKSSLVLNGTVSSTINHVKDKMYGVEFGVDSKDTRVIEQ